MATFVLPPSEEEPLYPSGVDEDEVLRIWAVSGRRSFFALATAFLNAGYGYRHNPDHPIYQLEMLAYGALTVRFVNQLDALLLYGRGYTWAWAARPKAWPEARPEIPGPRPEI